MNSSIIKQTKDVFKIKFRTTLVGGSFELSSSNNEKKFATLFACEEVTEEFIPEKLFKIMKRKAQTIELTISIKPIDHTFRATLDGGGFRFKEKGTEVWGQYHDGIRDWARKYKHSCKKAYFLFEIV